LIIGKKLVRLRKIGSTNDEARRLIKQGEGEGLVVIAAAQTKGKGKPGSRWHSPPGNLYFSAVVKPYKNQRKIALVTMIGALAGRAVLQSMTKAPVVIKWPNDLMLNGKKVGGILAERVPSGHLIIGIGLNLNTVPKLSTATSLRQVCGRRVRVARCAALLTAALDREYLAYLAKV
jgi:BirA family biotin operon repressor/biotin-[acetyl-CoA-carboxylase] ligase